MDRKYYKKLPEGWKNLLTKFILRVRKHIFLSMAITKIDGVEYLHLFSRNNNYLIPAENYNEYLEQLFGNSYIFIREDFYIGNLPLITDLFIYNELKSLQIGEDIGVIKNEKDVYKVYFLHRVSILNNLKTKSFASSYYFIIIIENGNITSHIFYDDEENEENYKNMLEFAKSLN